MLKAVLSLILILVQAMPSYGKLYCAQSPRIDLPYEIIHTAKRLDTINEYFGRVVFSRSVEDFLTAQGTPKGFEKIKIWWQLRKLKKVLGLIGSESYLSSIDRKKYAEKLERLSFITSDLDKIVDDPSLKRSYEDLRKAALYYGLNRFMDKAEKPRSVMGRIGLGSQSVAEVTKQIFVPRLSAPSSTESIAYKLATEGIKGNEREFDELSKRVGRKKAINLVFKGWSLYLLVGFFTLTGSIYFDYQAEMNMAKAETLNELELKRKKVEEQSTYKVQEKTTSDVMFEDMVARFEKDNGYRPSGLHLELYRAIADKNLEKAKEIMAILNAERELSSEPIQVIGLDSPQPDSPIRETVIEWSPRPTNFDEVEH
jgi:hypothetical protein